MPVCLPTWLAYDYQVSTPRYPAHMVTLNVKFQVRYVWVVTQTSGSFVWAGPAHKKVKCWMHLGCRRLIFCKSTRLHGRFYSLRISSERWKLFGLHSCPVGHGGWVCLFWFCSSSPFFPFLRCGSISKSILLIKKQLLTSRALNYLYR